MITYSKQTIDNNDILQVSKVLKSDFLTQGPKVPIFEKKICKFTSSKYCVAVNSASSGLYLACKALNLKDDDLSGQFLIHLRLQLIVYIKRL